MRKYLVLLLAAAVVFMMAPAMLQAQAPAAGKSVDLYAQIWFDAFYDRRDKNWTDKVYKSSEWQYDLSGKKADNKVTDFTFGLNPAVTRFGANFKNDNLTGRFEIRPVETNPGTGSSLGGILREAWAQYEFKDLMGMKVLVGQTYTPTWVPVGMAAWGGQGTWMGDLRVKDREPMVQVQLPLGPEKSSAKVALVSPRQVAVTGFDYIEQKFPKFEANYNLQMTAGMFNASVTPVFGYQNTKYKVQKAAGVTPTSETINAYIYGVSATFNIGPGFVKGAVHAAKNGNVYGMDQALLNVSYSGGDVNETDGFAYHLVAGAKVDIFTIYASYGYNKWEQKVAGVKTEDFRKWISVGAKIQVLPSLLLMPEWARRDKGESKTAGVKSGNRGKADYYGFETVIFL